MPFYAVYQFSSSPLLTVLGHLNRGFLEKGDQVSVRTKSDSGLRVAKVMRFIAIIR